MKNKKLIEQLQALAKDMGYEFIPNDQGSMHAEKFLYQKFGGKMDSIGVSHATGPCSGSCQPFFSDKNVELAWTGIWKR